MWQCCSCCNMIPSPLRFFSWAPQAVQLTESTLKIMRFQKKKKKEKSHILPSSPIVWTWNIRSSHSAPIGQAGDCCIKLSTKQSLPLPRTGCKCSDAAPAVPRKQMASSVCLTWEAKFPQGLERIGFWGRFTVHNTASGGFLLWLTRQKLEKSLPNFFFFPCGSRINALKSNPGFNLLWLSPWDWVVDLCFPFRTWEMSC